MFSSSPHFYVFSAIWHGDNQTPQTISAPLHLRLSAANLQHWNPFTQTRTRTHTPLFRQRGQFLFDPLWGLSPKPKCQHSLLTDSVSSNNPVTVYILRPADRQVTAVDLGHNRKSKGYKIYWGLWWSGTRQWCHAGIMPTLQFVNAFFLPRSILTICSNRLATCMTHNRTIIYTCTVVLVLFLHAADFAV